MQATTRVKFCGITRLEDALDAIALGADALGFVFYEKSPRAVSLKQAADIANQLPPFVSLVGLFVNAEADVIEQAKAQVRLNLLQFHGDESPEECERYACDWIKAIRVQAQTDLDVVSEQYAKAKALLLDAYDPEHYGGTGQVFDWTQIPDQRNYPVILAGGLRPDNVGRAIRQVKPYAVDVSGGIEQAKGIKDKEKMKAFMRGVKSVNE